MSDNQYDMWRVHQLVVFVIVALLFFSAGFWVGHDRGETYCNNYWIEQQDIGGGLIARGIEIQYVSSDTGDDEIYNERSS